MSFSLLFTNVPVGFKIMSVLVPVLAVGIFVFVFAMLLSPKLRGKVMSRQVKATKYMLDESKDTLTDIATTAGGIAADSADNILQQNEQTLTDIAARTGSIKVNAQHAILQQNGDKLGDIAAQTASIASPAVEAVARAVKKGVAEEEASVFCKYCGAPIDADSVFCKKCGRQQ